MWTSMATSRQQEGAWADIRKAACILMVLACLFLTACGSGPSVWERYLPAGQVPVRGIGNSYFTVPERMLEYDIVSRADEMKNPALPYILQEKQTVAFIEPNGLLLAEWKLDGEYTSVADMLPAVEEKAHLRIVRTAPYAAEELDRRHLVKNVFTCSAQGLFNPLYYGDYTGYLAVIMNDGETSCLFAGAKGFQSGQLLDSIRTFAIRNYDIHPVTGISGNSVTTGTPGSVLPGQEGRAHIWVMTPEGYEEQAVSVTLKSASRGRPQEASGASYGGDTPVKGKDIAYAVFSLDLGLEEPQAGVPYIPVLASGADGVWQPCVTVSETADTLVVAYACKGDTVTFDVGNKGLMIEARIKEG